MTNTNQIQQDAKSRMQKCIDVLQTELAKLRTGRAHPAILDHITVDYYGSPIPLSQVANISVLDARTLSLSPWEKSMVQVIEKAILSSDLGLNPTTSGTLIRISMPPLTQERRKELTKVVKNEAENAKVAIRNIRRDANQQFKNLLKDKHITEDEEHKGNEFIQKLTDQFVDDVDKLAAKKEQELLEI